MVVVGVMRLVSHDSPAEVYDRLLTAGGHQRRGKTLPYTSANGHMYSFLSPDGHVCLRLSETDRRGFHERHGGREVVQHGRVMKEYVAIPADVLESTESVVALLDASREYVLSLRPKPTRRR